MANVIIYTTPICPYCVRAKALFKNKHINYTEIDVSDEQERDKMIKLSNGKRSVPQIFINDKHIGGCDDLYELENKRQLDELLK